MIEYNEKYSYMIPSWEEAYISKYIQKYIYKYI